MIAVDAQLITESRFGLDGGAMFGIVPRPLWSRKAPPDDANRISMAANCWLIDLPGRRVLLDAGMGTRWAERERDIYAIRQPGPEPASALRHQGIDPATITDVVMTHLHFDHAGGLAGEGPKGETIPLFPDATCWIQRENWVWAHHPSQRDSGSYRREDFAWLGGPAAPKLELLDGVSRILDDAIEVLPMRGHTPGMQCVRVQLHGRTWVLCADLIPTRAHLPIPWVMGYDLDPVRSCAEKDELLDQAARHDWILVLSHEPDLPFITVERDARGRHGLALEAASVADMLHRLA
ncbi:MAG: MBL fold metallo-hydrolase [Deltaproteobacteria bacterium]|nr:MAG: MBL fold metallo-hydrolase [Deltaproteobacteria bacterium]